MQKPKKNEKYRTKESRKKKSSETRKNRNIIEILQNRKRRIWRRRHIYRTNSARKQKNFSKEIQAEFALEYEPIFIGEVELKAGDTIRLGEVGPNFGYDGGGIQIDLQQQWIGDFTELGKIEDWR